ncbi:DNA-binding protein inhibitor ID-4-like [Pomacea canaliculata]|uniref:DNA-binding protein inhibitor ID-4-like n=1 Tax=Pomacea canaliculata TaxID=400727 RepID=UPI000D737BC0|nr:DNA-binding protein inhibitor ID-4-like [Pomacea canaliculata]
MKMVRFSSGHRPSLTQMAARKQLRKHIRRIREREYSKLRALVPAVATKKKVTKVQVIEEAVRYIEELHAALVERFRQKHGCGAESMAQETVRSFVCQMMPPVRPQTAHTPVFHTHLEACPPSPASSSLTYPYPDSCLPAAMKNSESGPVFCFRKRRKDC